MSEAPEAAAFDVDAFMAAYDAAIEGGDAPATSPINYISSGGKMARLFEPHPQSGGPFGGRNNALAAFVGLMRAKRMPIEAAHEFAEIWNARHCVPPLADEDVRDMVSRAWVQWLEGGIPDATPEDAAGVDGADWPEPMTLADMRAEYEARGGLKWLIRHTILEGGMHLVIAPPCGGKSISVTHMMKECAEGGDWLGLTIGDEEPRAVPVLYIDEEMGILSTWTRMRKLGIREDAPLYYYNREGINIANKRHMAGVKKVCEDKGIKIVFFDTLIRCTTYDENSNSEMRKVSKDLAPLTKAGIAVVLLHHTRKSSAEKNGGMEHEDARGAADIVGMMDAVYRISNHGEGLYNIKNVKPRLVTAAESIDIDYRVEDTQTEDGKWRMTVEPLSREQRDAEVLAETEAAIINALRDGPMNTSAITEAVGTGCGKVLAELVEGLYIAAWKDGRKTMYGMPKDAPGGLGGEDGY